MVEHSLLSRNWCASRHNQLLNLEATQSLFRGEVLGGLAAANWQHNHQQHIRQVHYQTFKPHNPLNICLLTCVICLDSWLPRMMDTR